MNLYPATTKVIKAGKFRDPFLLFFGNRKQVDDERIDPLSDVLIGLLLGLVMASLGICIFSFFHGKLG
jgi:hypothetical protein